MNKLALVTLCICLTVTIASAKETAKAAGSEKAEIKEPLENITPVPETSMGSPGKKVMVEVSVQDVADFYVDLVVTAVMPCCTEKELPPINEKDDSSLLHRYHRMFNLQFTRAYHRWLDDNPSCRLFNAEITATRIKQFPVSSGTFADFNIPVGGTVRCVCPEGHDGQQLRVPSDSY